MTFLNRNFVPEVISSQDPSTEASQQEQFVRLEEKFLLPINLRQEFMSLVGTHLPLFYPIENTQYTLIESIYYDSQKLKSLVDHFNREPSRFKLRTRRYGPNGVWDENSDTFIELKTKQHDISDKMRLKIEDEDHHRLQCGRKLKLPVKKLRTAMKINDIIEEYRPKPVCRVTYRRFAYQEGQLRVTIDDQLKTQILKPLTVSRVKLEKMPWWTEAQNMGSEFSTETHSLVEVKHLGHIPDWLIEFMQKHQLSFRGFSKYCYTMLKHSQNSTKRSQGA